MLPPRPPFSFLIGTRAISPPSSHEPKSLSSGTRPASTGGSQLGSLSFQTTINPNSKRRRQCSIQGSGNDKEEGGLWNRWEFLVCMKAAPITDRKAERPKISACIRNLTRVLFPGISRAQNTPLSAAAPSLRYGAGAIGIPQHKTHDTRGAAGARRQGFALALRFQACMLFVYTSLSFSLSGPSVPSQTEYTIELCA